MGVSYSEFLTFDRGRIRQRYRETHNGHEPADTDVHHIEWRVTAEAEWFPTWDAAMADWGRPAPSTPPPTPSIVPLARDGKFLTRVGSIAMVREITCFLAFKRWLDNRQEELRPVLDWARGWGYDTIRVLGMVAWEGEAFGPADYSPAQARAFVDWCATQGMSVEFVVFADAQHVIPDVAAQRAHFDAISRALTGAPNVIVELANEPWQNGVAPSAFSDAFPGLTAKGSSPDDAIYGSPWDYATLHTPRDAEWMRKAKNAQEMRDAHLLPILLNEPIGAADFYQPGRRSNRPDEFFWYAGVAAMYSSGVCFHYENGLACRMPTQIEKDCAWAMKWAMDVIPPIWQTGAYTAGHLSTTPLVHDTSRCLRLYSSLRGNEAVSVAVAPRNWTPIPQNGWQIRSREGRYGEVVFLTR